MYKILLIDDDQNAHKVLQMLLNEEYLILSSLTGRDGLEKVRTEDPDVVLLDKSLPDIDGLEVLSLISAKTQAPPVIMLTCYDEIPVVVKAIQAGAVDYFVKPYKLEDLKTTLRKAVKEHGKRAGRELSTEDQKILSELQGFSPAIQNVKNLICRFSGSDAAILLSGESGTGKELVAKLIHKLSPKAKGPYIMKNCGAIPETLIETELFGSEKGAFTDAVSRPGSFEQAHGGTLFLDEIGELNPASQVKLLRVLEEKALVRVGGTKRIRLDVRIITATNRDLKEAIHEGDFRSDLFYRINILPITLPPLRERSEDIPVLANYFLKRDNTVSLIIKPSAMLKLKGYPWPGNVRELKNVIERARLLSNGREIQAKDLVF